MRNPERTIECKVRHICKSFGFKPTRVLFSFNDSKTYNLVDEFDGEPYEYEDPPGYDIDLYGFPELPERLSNKLHCKLDRYFSKIYKKHYLDLYCRFPD